jgi:hypothetical protein
MSRSKLCGQDLSSLVGAESPFSQVVFVGYDDGPTSGAAQCRSGAGAYRFEMLDMDAAGKYDRDAWDQGREIRIFSLAPLPAPAFERLAGALSQEQAQARMAQDAAYFDEVRFILDAASPPELVIATHGISTPVIAAREVSATEIATTQDWFAFLALASKT